jgi:hypothetical protein
LKFGGLPNNTERWQSRRIFFAPGKDKPQWFLGTGCIGEMAEEVLPRCVVAFVILLTALARGHESTSQRTARPLRLAAASEVSHACLRRAQNGQPQTMERSA